MYKSIRTKDFLKWFILGLYALFTLFMLFHHEIWADEAQAWLVVRDLGPSGIFRHVRTEGHPLLWYILIMPFAKLGFSIFSVQLLNWAVITVSLGVLFFKSPFNIYTKTSVLLSSGFLYWFSLNARSYCLIPLFVFLLAIFYGKQKEHPFLYASLIILLANTHVIMFGFCSALAILFLWENIKTKDFTKNKKSLLASILVFLSLSCIVFYIWGAQNENYIVKTYHHEFSFEYAFQIYSKVIFYLHGFVNLFNTAIFTLFLIFCAFVLFVKDKKIFFVYVFTLFYQMSVYILVWGILSQRAYALILAVMFCFWVVYKKLQPEKLKTAVNVFLIIIFLLSFPEAVKLLKQDYKYEFSGGKKAAEFIKENVPQDAFIVSNYPVTTVAVSAYLPRNKWRFYYDGYKDFYTYTLWNRVLPPSYTPVHLLEHLKNHKTVYVILSAGSLYEDIEPVYSSDVRVFTNQEKFRIYKIKGFTNGDN